MASMSCGNQPAKSDGDEPRKASSKLSDIVLRLLDLRGVIGENASPELRGSWAFDNRLKMFATICHFSSEIFQSLTFAMIRLNVPDRYRVDQSARFKSMLGLCSLKSRGAIGLLPRDLRCAFDGTPGI
jgi:hypothetical protein